jgi:predicted phosphodiesterase
VKTALIADIHEDIVSLKKALKLIEREKCDQIICLGDILGYPFRRAKYESTKNASECITLIKQTCSAVLLGNHDVFHTKKIPKNISGFKYPANWYDLSPEEKTRVSAGKVWNYSDDYSVELSEKELEYLHSLPEFVMKNTGESKILYSHFVYPNFTGSVCSYQGDGRKIREHFNFLNENSCKLSFCGHMHIEGIGIYYEPGDNIFSQLFKGFDYYSFGERKLKDKNCCISIPALADNGQVNGFAIFDSKNFSVNALSLNTNRRFIL